MVTRGGGTELDVKGSSPQNAQPPAQDRRGQVWGKMELVFRRFSEFRGGLGRRLWRAGAMPVAS